MGTESKLVKLHRDKEKGYPWCIQCHARMQKWFTNPNDYGEDVFWCQECHEYPINFFNRYLALPDSLMDYEYKYINVYSLIKQWAKVVWKMKLYDRKYLECVYFDFRI